MDVIVAVDVVGLVVVVDADVVGVEELEIVAGLAVVAGVVVVPTDSLVVVADWSPFPQPDPATTPTNAINAANLMMRTTPP